MNKKNVFMILGLIIFLSLGLVAQSKTEKTEKKDFEKFLSDVYPNKKFDYFLCDKIIMALNEGNIYLLSNDFLATKGYRGATNCLVCLKPKGEIVEVSIVKSGETPSFIRRIKKGPFLSSFKNKKLEDIDSVDTISRATLTTRAVKDDITKLLKDYKLMDIKVVKGNIVSSKHKISKIK